jgi:serine/arginine repetitive matrix protein 2
VTPSFELSTPPRPSFSTSKIEFETHPPPKGLPELPDPPSSSENETVSIPRILRMVFSSASTLQTHLVCPVRGHLLRLHVRDSPAYFILVCASRAGQVCRAQDQIRFLFTEIQSSTVATPSALFRAGTLPARTPAPPGAGFLHLYLFGGGGLLNVRFENMTSDSGHIRCRHGREGRKS